MKIYYGDDWKDAMSHSPVEITSAMQLAQYAENYNVIISADDIIEGENDIEDEEEE